jgi:ADP-ribose pyrophosphatase YjhB (NUDIX family)
MFAELRKYNVHVPDKIKQQANGRSHKLTFAAGGMIFAHNKVLLDRSDSSDMWSIPGGVIRTEESMQETVVREIREELNLRVEILNSPPFLYHFQVATTGSVEIILLMHFLVKVKAPAEIRMGGEIVDYKWESIGSHFRDAYPNVKPAIDYYMNI